MDSQVDENWFWHRERWRSLDNVNIYPKSLNKYYPLPNQFYVRSDPTYQQLQNVKISEFSFTLNIHIIQFDSH